MPKMKTKSGVKKRFKMTATGKIVFQRARKRHRLINKTPKRIRQLRGTSTLKECDAQIIRKHIPYGL